MPFFPFFKDVQSVGLESLAGFLGLMFENRALKIRSFIIYWFALICIYMCDALLQCVDTPC